MDLCERSAWRPVVGVSWLWWEQDGLYFEGLKKRESAELGGDEEIRKEEGIPLATTTGRE